MITKKEILEMVSDRGNTGARYGLFQALRTNQKNNEDWYNQKKDIRIHDAFKKIKLPTSRHMVDTFIAHLPMSNPTVKVVPFKPTLPYRKRAETQRDYYEALLQYNMQQTTNFVRDAAKDLGILGETYLKIIWDEGVLTPGLKDDERRAEILERMPLKIMARQPRNCYPSPDHIDTRPADIIEVYKLTAGEVKRLYPKWKQKTTDTAPVVFLEYWSRDALCFMADGVPVTDDVEKNPYGLVPYCHVYSGFGHRDTDMSPASLAVGLFQYSLDLLAQQCRYHSYMDMAASFAAMPQVILPGTKSEYEEGGKKLVPKPGDVYFMGDSPSGDQAKIVWAASGMPAGILNAMSINESQISKVQPTVLRGQAPEGMDSGYPMALMIGEARLEFGIPLENLGAAFSRALETVRILYRDVVKEDVPIWGKNGAITLSPQDCDGAYRISVEFDATTPDAALQRALLLQRLTEGGGLSKQTALELNPLIKNPSQEQIRQDMESLRKHPAIQRLIATKAVAAKEGEEAAQAIEQAMAEGESGAIRKGESSGIPPGGELNPSSPESTIQQVLSRKNVQRRERGQ